jgi:hypothetical protein
MMMMTPMMAIPAGERAGTYTLVVLPSSTVYLLAKCILADLC